MTTTNQDSCSVAVTEQSRLLPGSSSNSSRITFSDQRQVEDEDSNSSSLSLLNQEAALLAGTSFPVILTYLLQYSFGFITLLVIGRIGPNELAAAALGNMALVVIVFSPATGLASALDTLCSTAFTASHDKTLVGFHLQRGIIAISIHFVLVAIGLWYLDDLLIWLQQDVGVAVLCGKFVRMQLLGGYAWMLFECVKRFLQAQGIMHASTYVLLIVLPVHLITSYLFVWSSSIGFGFMGAAAANVLTEWLMLAGIVIYARNSKARAAWGGWSMQAIKAMLQYFKLALPSMIMICCEWWILDLLALAASYLGNTTLAAQSIVINTCSITYQIPDGLSVAVCNRVGNLIGQARTRRARISAYLGLSLALVVGILTLVLSMSVSNIWGWVYSDDKRIVAGVALILPICGLFQMFDSMNSVGSGVLRSLGRQDAGALINFPAYYVVGFPLGLYLTYGSPHLGVVGLWYGICVGVALAVAPQLYICLRTNWASEVERCMARVTKDYNTLQGSGDEVDDGFSNSSDNDEN